LNFGKLNALTTEKQKDITHSLDISEIAKDASQSALVDNARDISFLMNAEKSEEIKEEQLLKDHLGVKPSKIKGHQAEYLEKILNRRREINPTIVNKIVIDSPQVKNYATEEQKSPEKLFSHLPTENITTETKITKPLKSSISVPKKPETMNTTQVETKHTDSEKKDSSYEQRRIIEDMISQGNTIFEVVTGFDF
jgi:hypothetical protein